MRELVEELIELLREDAAELGCLAELERARAIVAEGTSADRQLASTGPRWSRGRAAGGAAGRGALAGGGDARGCSRLTPSPRRLPPPSGLARSSSSTYSPILGDLLDQPMPALGAVQAGNPPAPWVGRPSTRSRSPGAIASSRLRALSTGSGQESPRVSRTNSPAIPSVLVARSPPLHIVRPTLAGRGPG